jgi:hypothetical protein
MNTLYRFALWAETPVPHAIISFILLSAGAFLLIAVRLV